MFAIRWQYLLGKSVAADIADRSVAEWPPHPDRVYQALVAAWGESGCGDAGRAALEWLEAQPSPDIEVPVIVADDSGLDASEEESTAALLPVPKVYVPVNDVGRPKAKGAPELSVLPSNRKRMERFFPSVHVGDAVCSLVYPVSDPGEHDEVLRALCAGVSRIGHSSSVVRCWLERVAVEGTYIPARNRRDTELSLRVPEVGRLRSLESAFADGGPEWARPSTSGWAGYRRKAPVTAVEGPWARLEWVLRRVYGDVPDLRSTHDLARALRSALITHCADSRALAVISGHAPDGGAVPGPHLAVAPLPFAGHAHADGHLLGLAIALPRDLASGVEDGVLQALARLIDSETGVLQLSWGRHRSTSFVLEERDSESRPHALRPATWCAPSRRFATVTPVVLDRQPPRRERDRDAFVAREIAAMCERSGFPRPSDVSIGDVALLEGVGPSWEFPPLPTKSGQSRRHLHAVIDFGVPVCGPVLIGAGRHRGLGFLKPVNGAKS